MIMNGRPISPGKAEGEAVTYEGAFSFLGGVDGNTGDFTSRPGNIAGKVFVFSGGKGSTVGSYVIYNLKVHGRAPVALVNQTAETIVTTGAVISDVPMVDGVDVSLIRDGDRVVVDGDTGTVELPDVEVADVSTSMIVADGKVLLLHRPDTARSFPGKWSLVSGSVERNELPLQTARREVMEETGLNVGYPDGSLPHFSVREKNRIWVVHPVMFVLSEAEVRLNGENTEYVWVPIDKAAGCVGLVDGVADIIRGFSGLL